MQRRRHPRIALFLTGLVMASGLVLVAAPAAHAAAPDAVTGGRITWGIKSSFRSYLVSPGAAGSITPSQEATQEAGNGRLRFPVSWGSSDVAGGAVSAESVGAVRLTGHDDVLDVTLTQVRIRITGTTGTLVVDATSRPYSPGQTTPAAPVTYEDLTFATLDLTGITPSSTGTGNTWTNIPAKLTAAGVPVLAGFYPAGTDLDPVTFTTALNQVPTCSLGTPRVTAATAETFTLGLSPGTCTPSTATGFNLTVQVVGQQSGYSGDLDLAETTITMTNRVPAQVINVKVVPTNEAGAGSAKTVDTVLPFKSLDAFIDQQYRDFRLRPATASEKTTLRNQLRAGTTNPAIVVQQLIDGPDWAGKQSPVIRLFRAYFKRLPDLGGLNYWTNKSRAGTRIGVISSNFAGSNEFKTKYGNTSNRKFVELVYENVLGRPGDAGGLASWTRKLDQRVKTRGEVMIGFSESNEYKNKTAREVSIVNLYTGLFRFVPSQAQIDDAGDMVFTGATLRPFIGIGMTMPWYLPRIVQ
jgi:hypothetical protein